MDARDVGLTEAEYQIILERLGRRPNDLELGLFGVLWSEHCSYKSSKNLLRWLPNKGPWVVQGPGENAGVVQLNDTWDVAFKVESHNHPSYVEPVQGAATGVGGIIRDIVAMGARPVALADSLRFGLDERSRHLQDGVVQGVGNYGNAIGIPTVTGEVYYGAPYEKNPLVNVLCVGLRKHGQTIGAGGARPGDLIFLIGQKTGRDGIHGASLLASQDFNQDAHTMRPTVQVGDPFLGKLLMETTLAAIASGQTEAVQDLGAAGLTSSVAELLDHSGVGAVLWLDRVPCRETGMTPYEIMLSETQERMLLVAKPEAEGLLRKIVEHFEIPMTAIGEITDEDRLEILFSGDRVADLPPSILVNACPRLELPEGIADRVRTARAGGPTEIRSAFDPRRALEVLGAPDCRDRSSIYRQYDSMIQTNTVVGPGHDTAVLRVRGSEEGLAVTVSGPGRWAAVDSYAGGAGAVSRVVGQLATQGAFPLGLTDGINAGNPTKPEVFHSLAGLIAGISDAAQVLKVPVTGGNVSLHNETEGQAIWPTAVIGGVGRHPSPLSPVFDGLSQPNDAIYLVNPTDTPNLGGSVFESMLNRLNAYPRPDLHRDRLAYECLIEWLTGDDGIEACRLIQDGGLFVALARMMMSARQPGLGVDIRLADDRIDQWLFNEASGQILVVARIPESRFVQKAQEKGVAVVELGRVTDDNTLTITGGRTYRWHLLELTATYHQGYRG